MKMCFFAYLLIASFSLSAADQSMDKEPISEREKRLLEKEKKYDVIIKYYEEIKKIFEQNEENPDMASILPPEKCTAYLTGLEPVYLRALVSGITALQTPEILWDLILSSLTTAWENPSEALASFNSKKEELKDYFEEEDKTIIDGLSVFLDNTKDLRIIVPLLWDNVVKLHIEDTFNDLKDDLMDNVISLLNMFEEMYSQEDGFETIQDEFKKIKWMLESKKNTAAIQDDEHEKDKDLFTFYEARFNANCSIE